MRVTNNMLFDLLTNELLRSNERLLGTYETLSSGKKVNRPSDDPVAASGILDYKKILANLDQYKRNIQFAEEYLANTETALSEVTNTLSRLRELAVEQASDSATAETRLNASYEVDTLFNGLIAAGNTRFGDRYLFSGYLTTTQPFDTSGTYSGDNNESTLKIGQGITFTYGITGNKIFKGVGTTGGVDIYTIVQNFSTALQANNETNIQAAIATLDSSISQINDIVAELGARLNRLESQKEVIGGFRVEAEIILSGMEDADMTDVSIELAMNQTSLEALQLATSKVLELNIFRFIR